MKDYWIHALKSIGSNTSFFMNDFKAFAFGVVLFLFYSPYSMNKTIKHRWRKKQLSPSTIRKEIRLLPEQLSILEKGAKNHGKALSRFIPQAALSYCNEVFMTPDLEQIQQVCLSCREVSNALYDIAYKHPTFTQEDLHTINDMVAVLEQSLLHILHHPPRLKDILHEAFKDKKLRPWLRKQIAVLQAAAS